METVGIGSTEATPLVRESSGSEGLYQTANKTNSIGRWLLNLLTSLFSCCFRSQLDQEDMSSNGLAERVNLPPPRIRLDGSAATIPKPPPPILIIKAFNRGESHSYSSDRVDVYINGRQNMGAPLHELSGSTPYRSMERTNNPLSVTVEVSSQGKDYRIDLPVLESLELFLLKRSQTPYFKLQSSHMMRVALCTQQDKWHSSTRRLSMNILDSQLLSILIEQEKSGNN